MIYILFLFLSILGTIAFVALIVMMFIVWIEDMKFKKEMKKLGIARMTRYEKIKNMTFDEMVEFCVNNISCFACPIANCDCNADTAKCEKYFRKWLNGKGDV